MKKKKFYWKVVRVSPSGYWSSYVTDSGLMLRYAVGEKTRPEVGKLFLFDSLQHARAYVTTVYLCEETLVVLRGAATGVSLLPFVLEYPDLELCQRFWSKDPLEKTYLYNQGDAVRGWLGAVVASSFTPLEIVQ